MTNVRPGSDAIAGIILAGGRSTRMGREKALIALADIPVIAHVAARLKPQIARLAVSANGDAARFAFLNAPALPDRVGAPGDEGPLAGIIAGLRWAASQGFAHVVFVPSDAPFLPDDLVARLADGAPPDAVSIAESARGMEPLFSLWPAAALAQLEKAFADGERAPRRVIAGLPHRLVRFDAGSSEPDPFLNINTPEDLAKAEKRLSAAHESS